MSSDPCPGCGVPRVSGPECPRCGILYARADARRARLAEQRVAVVDAAAPAADEPWAGVLRPEVPAWSGGADEARTELKLRAAAIPASLLVAWLLVSTGMGHFIARTFFSMWLHELGHAISAWLGSFPAFPGPWFTRVGEQRSFGVGVFVVAALAAWTVFIVRSRRYVQLMVVGPLAIGFVLLTFVLSSSRAYALMIFAGDGGALLLGTLAMSTMNAPDGSRLKTGWLRWGFVVIGAFTVVDVANTWFAARADVAAIPFGMNEGSGLSDASKLVDVYRWTEQQLVSRYVALAVGCFVALALIYAHGLARARRMLAMLEAGDASAPS